jgi:hypothetical protein
MSKSRNIADLGSNDVLETDANGVTVTGGVASDTLNVDSGTLFVDGANNRVGVGTDSPSTPISIKESMPTISMIDADDDSISEILANNGSLQLRANQNNAVTSGTIRFIADGSEAARIDSSGNLLVGTSSPDARLTVKSDDEFSTSASPASGNDSIYLDARSVNTGVFGSSIGFSRNDNNLRKAAIVSKKTGSNPNKVGLSFFTAPTSANNDPIEEQVIITHDGNLLVGTTTSPSDAGAIVANSGVYLGGTGAANKLDDYEEGTWTPSIDGINFSTIEGVYKKIGSIVYVSFRLDGGSGSANIPEIDGLPFTASSQMRYASNGNYIGEVNGAVSGMDYYTRTQNGENIIRILKRDGSSHTSVNPNEVPTSTIRLSITYITDS